MCDSVMCMCVFASVRTRVCIVCVYAHAYVCACACVDVCVLVYNSLVGRVLLSRLDLVGPCSSSTWASDSGENYVYHQHTA